MDKIKAPFTPEQVTNLNKWQHHPYCHGFTCGNKKCRAFLVATVRGWICPYCDYTQDWAHDFMGKEPPDVNFCKEEMKKQRCRSSESFNADANVFQGCILDKGHEGECDIKTLPEAWRMPIGEK